MSNPINTIPIQQFIQQVKSADISNQKEIKLDIKSAKLLSYCLGELNAKLLEDYDKILIELKKNSGSGPIELKMDGGDFYDN
jgi:hypothetical protein